MATGSRARQLRGNSGLGALTGSFAHIASTLAQPIRLGVAFHKTVMAMRQRLSFIILPMLVQWSPALPQTVNSTQQGALKSNSQSPKWTEVDERALLSKAQQGDASSQMWLGCAYEQGWFGKTNFPEALKWFRKSAELGDPDAQNALGQMYEDGEGVTQNYASAAKWYRKAAEHVPDFGGAGQGRNHLGLLYLDGHGVPQRLRSGLHVVQFGWRIKPKPALCQRPHDCRPDS